eukprot:7590899-Alexandrium_andersonii.AAC.1
MAQHNSTAPRPAARAGPLCQTGLAALVPRAPSGPTPAGASPRTRPAGRGAAPARPRAGSAPRAPPPRVGPPTAATKPVWRRP